MKITTLILAAFLLGIFSSSAMNAESTAENQSSKEELSETIKTVLQNIPLQDLMLTHERCKLNVYFEINNDNEITNIQINGSNPELVHYALNELKQAPIKVSPLIEHKKYNVNIQCILR